MKVTIADIEHARQRGNVATMVFLVYIYNQEHPNDPFVFRDNLGDVTDNRPMFRLKSEAKHE